MASMAGNKTIVSLNKRRLQEIDDMIEKLIRDRKNIDKAIAYFERLEAQSPAGGRQENCGTKRMWRVAKSGNPTE